MMANAWRSHSTALPNYLVSAGSQMFIMYLPGGSCSVCTARFCTLVCKRSNEAEVACVLRNLV
jgi:hypothetical protein